MNTDWPNNHIAKKNTLGGTATHKESTKIDFRQIGIFDFRSPILKKTQLEHWWDGVGGGEQM